MAIVSLNTIKNWFKTGLRPTQAQFWDSWDSFWHKSDSIPMSSIEGLEDAFGNIDFPQISKTSSLLNDGSDGINNYITSEDIPFIPSIEGLATVAQVNTKFDILDLYNLLDCTVTGKALDARQGLTLKNLIGTKQNTLTNPVTGIGTVNTLPKRLLGSEIGDSQFVDNGINAGVGAVQPTSKFKIKDILLAINGLYGSVLDLEQTWNTTGTPTAFLLNVIDILSNNGFLIDLKVNGTSKFSVDKTGVLRLQPTNVSQYLIFDFASGTSLIMDGTRIIQRSGGGLIIGGSAGYISFRSGTGSLEGMRQAASSRNIVINSSFDVGAKFQVFGTSLLNGVRFISQPLPAEINITATLTHDNLKSNIVTVKNAAAINLTLPSGVSLDGNLLGLNLLPIDAGLEWNVMNLQGSIGAVTVVGTLDNQLIGNPIVQINSQATFRTVKRALDTFVTYRIS